jgi:RNA polymerase sigma factor (sigma-70 family)
MKALDITQEIINLRPTLRMFTLRFTRNREESLDLVQDTMLKALTYKDKFREQTNLKGWLFTIMRNTFINNYRRLQRTKTSHDDTKELFYLNVEDTHTFNSPSARYEYLDIWKNVNEIKEELLIPFKMHASGYKYNEIAEHLNIPIGTVKNRIFHARKEIQKKLTGYSLPSTKDDE